jgi:transcriptional regulator with XRE-family HTH domain
MRAPKNIVGATVRRLRNAAGLSQPAFAALCQRLGWDVSREVLAQVESRFRYVTDWELVVLARALKVQPADLIPQKFAKPGRVPPLDQA